MDPTPSSNPFAVRAGCVSVASISSSSVTKGQGAWIFIVPNLRVRVFSRNVVCLGLDTIDSLTCEGESVPLRLDFRQDFVASYTLAATIFGVNGAKEGLHLVEKARFLLDTRLGLRKLF